MLCIYPPSNCIPHSNFATSQRRLCLESDIKQEHEATAGAGVRCVVVETRHPSHAKDIVAALPMHELELYNGILAVIFCHTTTSLACCATLRRSATQPGCHICGAIMHTRTAHETRSASDWDHDSECMPQVGGDGLFQEVLDGVAALRCGADAQRAAAAAQLRLGHIPGGSTDAAAYSMHGTRSAACAALHAAIGDRYAHSQCRLGSAGHGSAQQVSSAIL